LKNLEDNILLSKNPDIAGCSAEEINCLCYELDPNY